MTHVKTQKEIFRDAGFDEVAANYPRSEDALKAIAAFNNVTVEELSYANRFHPNQSSMNAWERVVTTLKGQQHDN